MGILESMAIAGHNLLKYRSLSNPSFEYLISTGKNPEELAYSAFKTDGGDLGLENNGFGDTLDVWKILKNNGEVDIYPENIDKETVAYLKTKGSGKITKEVVLAEYGLLKNQKVSTHIKQLSEKTQQLNVMNERVDALSNHLGQLQNDIQNNDKKATQGIAAVAALGNTEFPSLSGKAVVGAGVGSYEGRQAVAINISHRPEKIGSMNFHAGIGASAGGKPVMRFGTSYEF